MIFRCLSTMIGRGIQMIDTPPLAHASFLDQTWSCGCLIDNPLCPSWASKRSTMQWPTPQQSYDDCANFSEKLEFVCHMCCTSSMTKVSIVHNLIIQAQMWHMEIDYHYVREFFGNKSLQVQHVPSEQQVADIFAKGLSTNLFYQNHRSLNLIIIKPQWLKGVSEYIE